MNDVVGLRELKALLAAPRRFPMALPGYGVAQVMVQRSPAVMKRAIRRYEAAVGGLPQTDLPVRHFYIEGRPASHVYAREIFIAAGVAAVGHVHKYQVINIISKGRVLVASEEGVREIRAPFTWVSQPGAKRALYVLEDLIWTTVHLTDELDEAKIKADLGTVTYEEFEEFQREMGHEPPALAP